MMDVPLVVEGCVLVAGIQKDDGMNMVGTVEGKHVKIKCREVYTKLRGKKERSSQEREETEYFSG